MHTPRPPKPHETAAPDRQKAPVAPGSEAAAEEPSGTELPLPHERDQQMHVRPEPDPVIRQAARDLAAGQVDTDLRATPGLDAERRERLVRPPPKR